MTEHGPEKFDLFLSYHSKDKDAARSFALQLKSHGLSVWFDELDLPLGKMFPQSLEKALGAASAFAALVGPAGIGPWEQAEINVALIRHVQAGRPVIPVLLPGAPTKPRLPLFLEPFPWLDLRAGIDSEAIRKLIRSVSGLGLQYLSPSAVPPDTTLHAILRRAQKHVVVSGHTLDRFSRDINVKEALCKLLGSGVRITIVHLNPNSRYAIAHQPYHEIESTSPAIDQHRKTLEFFRSLFEDLDLSQKRNLEILLTNYMPKFRTFIVDGTVYVYLYMYGVDVANTPDMILEASAAGDLEDLRRRVIYSTMKLINAPEAIPYIRCGRLFEYWEESKLSKWDSWSQEERAHHRLTHEFYVTFAQQFHQRFGFLLEREVKAHIDQMTGNTLVIGCGSGKEVDYIVRCRPNSMVYGIDFSHVAIELARMEHPHLEDRFLLGDFYDLDYILPGQFDSIVANAAFVHLYNRNDLDELLRKIWGKLTDGGQCFLRGLYKEKNGIHMMEEIDDSSGHIEEWKTSRWFVYFSRADLAEHCRNVGFEVLDDITLEIARRECGISGKQLKMIRDKGFLHSQHKGVFWPTLIMRKTLLNPSAGIPMRK